ncbi:hypothetical protein CDAR_392181 [Caerostris darwini]|uniref:Uncharacterized protein n=1 Tax=Caerostris darwini TaxID=1538125 RepID=A0AAV4UHC2_9ARAC|nr:hypothetical protein CDAR_392181 [Caerostris darwini]
MKASNLSPNTSPFSPGKRRHCWGYVTRLLAAFSPSSLAEGKKKKGKKETKREKKERKNKGEEYKKYCSKIITASSDGPARKKTFIAPH